MWQTKYASAVPKNLGLGLNFGRAVKVISYLGVRTPCIWVSWCYIIGQKALYKKCFSLKESSSYLFFT